MIFNYMLSEIGVFKKYEWENGYDDEIGELCSNFSSGYLYIFHTHSLEKGMYSIFPLFCIHFVQIHLEKV